MPLRRSRLFHFVLVAVTAIGPMSMQIFLPALPAIGVYFAVPTGTAQLTLSLTMYAIAVTTLFYGPLSDRFGRRPVLIAGMVVFLAGTAVSALAPTIWILIAGRVLQGAGGASGMVLARAMVRDVHGRERSASVIAYLTMVMVMAPMVAPFLGGVLTDAFGWRANFAAMCAMIAVTLALVVFGLPETRVRDGAEGPQPRALSGVRSVLGNIAFWRYALQSSFTMGMFFAFIAATPYLMVTVMGRPATEFGLYFMLTAFGFMVGNFVAARASPRIGLDRMILRGALLTCVVLGVAVAVVADGTVTPLALFLPATAMAFSNGLVAPNAQAAAISADPRAAGAASGIMGFMQMFTAASVAQAVGNLEDGTPWPMLAFMTGCAILVLAAHWLGGRRDERAAPPK